MKINTNKALQKHQKVSIKKINKFLLNAEEDKFLVSYPVARGKSFLIRSIAEDLLNQKKKFLIVTPSTAIKDDFIIKLTKEKVGNLDEENKIILTTFQELTLNYRNKSHFTLIKFDLILIDEGHYFVAKEWNKVFNNKVKKILFTATPYRNDSRWVRHDVSDILYDKDFDSIKPQIHFKNMENDLIKCLKKIKINKNDKILIKITKKDAKDFYKKIKTSTKFKIATLFSEKLSKEECNYDSYQKLKECPTQYNCILFDEMLIEGVDDPTFKFLFVLSELNNDKQSIQLLGRLLRNGKKTVEVYENNNKLKESYDRYNKYQEINSKIRLADRVSSPLHEMFKNNKDWVYDHSVGKFKEMTVDSIDFNNILFKQSAKVFRYDKTTFLEIKNTFDQLFEKIIDESINITELINITNIPSKKNIIIKAYKELKSNKNFKDFVPEVKFNLIGLYYHDSYVFIFGTNKSQLTEITQLCEKLEMKEMNQKIGDGTISALNSKSIEINNKGIKSIKTKGNDLEEYMFQNSVTHKVNSIDYKKNGFRGQINYNTSRIEESPNMISFEKFVFWCERIVLDLNSSKKIKFVDKIMNIYSSPIGITEKQLKKIKLISVEFFSKKTKLNELYNFLSNDQNILQLRYSGHVYNLRYNFNYIPSIKKNVFEFELIDSLDGVADVPAMFKEMKNNYKQFLENYNFILEFDNNLTYVDNSFYRTDFAYEIKKRYIKENLIYSDIFLNNITKEKGAGSIFDYIIDKSYDKKNNNDCALANELNKYNYLLVDDDSKENADFLLFNENNANILIHAKAAKSKYSATDLQEVLNQSLKNIHYLDGKNKNIFKEKGSKAEETRFDNETSLHTYLVGKKKKGVSRKYEKTDNGLTETNKSSKELINLYKKNLQKNEIKEVWVVIAGGVIFDVLIKEFDNIEERRETKQIINLLYNIATKMGQYNIRLKIFIPKS